MPAPTLGNAFVLKVSFTNNEGGATTISGPDNGLANIDVGDDVNVAESRGGGSPIRVRIFVSPTMSLTCDRNSITKQFFDPEHNGKTIYLWAFPDGEGSGNPKETATAILQSSRSAPTDGPMEFAVEFFLSGARAYTTV